MTLSVIITNLNEEPFELNQTIASIRATAGDKVEIIVVDDQSSTPVECEDKTVRVIHNRFRCGVGPSRHIGACHAKGDWLLITDSHMRFNPGWYEAFDDAVLDHLQTNQEFNVRETLYCGCCIYLNWQNMDMAQAKSRYYGATLNVYGPDRNVPDKMQVFEAIWLPKEQWPADGAEIPVVMGACYFIDRTWFLALRPTVNLKTWGQDETMLSVKTWLAGGCVRMIRGVEIGHRFQVSEEEFRKMKLAGKVETVQPKKPFAAPPGHANFNKLLAIYSLCGDALADKLVALMDNAADGADLKIAKAMIRDDWRIVAAERADNQALFVHDFEWFCDRFKIPLP